MELLFFGAAIAFGAYKSKGKSESKTDFKRSNSKLQKLQFRQLTRDVTHGTPDDVLNSGFNNSGEFEDAISLSKMCRLVNFVNNGNVSYQGSMLGYMVGRYIENSRPFFPDIADYDALQVSEWFNIIQHIWRHTTSESMETHYYRYVNLKHIQHDIQYTPLSLAFYYNNKDLITLFCTSTQYVVHKHWFEQRIENNQIQSWQPHMFCVYQKLNQYVIKMIRHKWDFLFDNTKFIYDANCIEIDNKITYEDDMVNCNDDKERKECKAAYDQFDESGPINKAKIHIHGSMIYLAILCDNKQVFDELFKLYMQFKHSHPEFIRRRLNSSNTRFENQSITQTYIPLIRSHDQVAADGDSQANDIEEKDNAESQETAPLIQSIIGTDIGDIDVIHSDEYKHENIFCDDENEQDEHAALINVSEDKNDTSDDIHNDGVTCKIKENLMHIAILKKNVDVMKSLVAGGIDLSAAWKADDKKYSCMDLVSIVSDKNYDFRLKKSMIHILTHKWFPDMLHVYDETSQHCIKMFVEWCDDHKIPQECSDCCIEYYLWFDDSSIALEAEQMKPKQEQTVDTGNTCENALQSHPSDCCCCSNCTCIIC